MEASKLTFVQEQIADWDKNKEKYVFDIFYTTPFGPDQQQKTHNGIGLSVFNQHINDLLERYKAETITVIFKTGISPKAGKKGAPVTIIVNDNADTSKIQNIIYTPVKRENEVQKSSDLSFAGLSGINGLDAYLNLKEQLMQANLNLQIAQADIKRKEEELSNLQKNKNEVEKENDELWEANDKLNGTVEKLKKYVPEDNFQIFGLDGTKLFGKFLERAAIGLASRNPQATAKILGISTAELSGILNDPEEISQNAINGKTLDPSHVEVEELPDNLTDEQKKHFEAAKGVYVWCKAISTSDLRKIIQLLQLFEKNMAAIDIALETVQNISNN